MSDEQSLTETITAAAEQQAGRSRATLVRRLVDIVAVTNAKIPQQDRHMAADILLDMMFHATEEERRLCAERLEESRDAPRRLLRYLSQCAFTIGRPIIENNPGLNGIDLIEIAQLGTAEHRLAIAQRRDLPGSICVYLSEHAEPHIIRELVANRTASLPEQAMDFLVARSRDDTALCNLLIERIETSPGHAMAMFWWADGPTRRKILQKHASDRLAVIEMCSDIFEMAAKEKWQDEISRKALQMIERRQRNRAAIEKSQFDSLEEAINAAGRGGMTADLAQEIGYLSGVKPVTIAKILSDKGGEGLAVLAKATGLKRDFLPVLWVALKRPLKIDEENVHPLFEIVSETYEILSVPKAQTVLRYWNWSLSSSFSPRGQNGPGVGEETANDEIEYSTSQRTAKLVFGNG